MITLSTRPTVDQQRHNIAPVVLQAAYAVDARRYDQRTQAFQAFRRAIVDALCLRAGDTVLDVGCGTGLCFAMLAEKVGPEGRVLGIDASPDMAAVSRERVAREGWTNVEVLVAPIAAAQIPSGADAALFCAVHDILQSDEAVRRVVDSLRPGAAVAAGGGKWADPWMVALNLQVRALHGPYVADFDGFDRPWRHLERRTENFRVHELAFGSGYVATGTSPAASGGS
jgi:demethylmenaquinone methyltransferase/2-methoxy-6-polyprenyl-1,4-benzoquinol methylase